MNGDQQSDDKRSIQRRDNKRGKRKRRRIVWGSLVGLAVVVGTALGLTYEVLQPTRHFGSGQPIVSQPKAGPAYSVQNGEFNLLLLGVDSRTPNEPARSDSILLIHANLKTHQFDVLSIARDTRVDIEPYGYTKITHANYLGDLHGGALQGIKEASQAVSDLTGLPINYYAETNHFGLQNIVDAIGGVTVYVPFDVPIVNAWYPALNGQTIPKGYQTLDGEMASELVHQRELLPNGDFSRQQLQEDLLLSMAKKLEQPQNWPLIPKFIQALPRFLTETNLTTTDMMSLAMAVKDFRKKDVHYFQIPGSSYSGLDPIVGQTLDYWQPNMPQLRQIIARNFAN